MSTPEIRPGPFGNNPMREYRPDVRPVEEAPAPSQRRGLIDARQALSLGLIVIGSAGVVIFTSLVFGVLVGMLVLSGVALGLGLLLGLV